MCFRFSTFQPTLPARGATPRGTDATGCPPISTHAPRTGSDLGTPSPLRAQFYFNPRSPHGERQLLAAVSFCAEGFQPTLPARGATLSVAGKRAGIHISTHAPRTGSDLGHACADARGDISTHAPRTGSDRRLWYGYSATTIFQPTLPARGATFVEPDSFEIYSHFNPRSPHGERPRPLTTVMKSQRFQPTLPARGATARSRRKSTSRPRFQPTLPARGATLKVLVLAAVTGHFNPRSPHGERRTGRNAPRRVADFNPRSPHGERRIVASGSSSPMPFQPTLPARGATAGYQLPRAAVEAFQPTLPARGATGGSRSITDRCHYFNPRSPHGERRRRASAARCCRWISTHAPRTGSDPRAPFRRA